MNTENYGISLYGADPDTIYCSRCGQPEDLCDCDPDYEGDEEDYNVKYCDEHSLNYRGEKCPLCYSYCTIHNIYYSNEGDRCPGCAAEEEGEEDDLSICSSCGKTFYNPESESEYCRDCRKCPHCQTVNDMLASDGWCPHCGYPENSSLCHIWCNHSEVKVYFNNELIWPCHS